MLEISDKAGSVLWLLSLEGAAGSKEAPALKCQIADPHQLLIWMLQKTQAGSDS